RAPRESAIHFWHTTGSRPAPGVLSSGRQDVRWALLPCVTGPRTRTTADPSVAARSSLAIGDRPQGATDHRRRDLSCVRHRELPPTWRQFRFSGRLHAPHVALWHRPS